MKNTGLTKREKILIIIGVAFLVLFGAGNFLIIPAYNDYVEKSERVVDLRFEKMDIEMKIAGRANDEAIRDRTLERYDNLAASFQNRMSNYDIDKLITGIITDHNLMPINLNIKDVDYDSTVSKRPVSVSMIADHSSIKNLITTINSTDYIYITMFNYTMKDGALIVDIDFNLLILDENWSTESIEEEEQD